MTQRQVKTGNAGVCYDVLAMVKHRLSRSYAKMLAEKAMELANASLVGIVLVQFLPNQPFRLSVALFGVATFVLLHVGAFFLLEGVNNYYVSATD